MLSHADSKVETEVVSATGAGMEYVVQASMVRVVEESLRLIVNIQCHKTVRLLLDVAKHRCFI